MEQLIIGGNKNKDLYKNINLKPFLKQQKNKMSKANP